MHINIYTRTHTSMFACTHLYMCTCLHIIERLLALRGSLLCCPHISINCAPTPVDATAAWTMLNTRPMLSY